MNSELWLRRIVKPTVFFVSLLPATLLTWYALTDQLGANPIEEIVRTSGDWTLRFLLITLAITPTRRLSGFHWIARLRRMIGLFAFFYACLHFLSYLVLDQFFAWGEILKDILKRPFITVGLVSFVMLVPLAVTSTNKMMKRLGGKRWQRLHQSVYIIACGGVLHYLWMVKADIRDPIIYGSILILLLSHRAWSKRKEEAVRRRRAHSATI